MWKFKGTKGIIILVILIFAFIGYYFYLSNRTASLKEEDTTSTKVVEVLLRDLDKNYPPTPKEVVRFYSEITMCFYNEKYTDSELEQLAEQANKLLDPVLIENQPNYLEELKLEILRFEEEKIKIIDFTTSSSVDIENEKFKEDGYDWTRVYCYFTMKKGKSSASSDEVFLLRKDESGYWKIYGWDLVEKNE